jgi:hypothetical protein
VTAAAAGASLAFTALCVACLAYLHLAQTGYSPVRNAVSEYGVGEFAAWYRTQAAAAGLAGAALAVALDGPTRVVVLLGVFAAARLPRDHAGAARRATGRLLAAGGPRVRLDHARRNPA